MKVLYTAAIPQQVQASLLQNDFRFPPEQKQFWRVRRNHTFNVILFYRKVRHSAMARASSPLALGAGAWPQHTPSLPRCFCFHSVWKTGWFPLHSWNAATNLAPQVDFSYFMQVFFLEIELTIYRVCKYLSLQLVSSYFTRLS